MLPTSGKPLGPLIASNGLISLKGHEDTCRFNLALMKSTDLFILHVLLLIELDFLEKLIFAKVLFLGFELHLWTVIVSV